MEIGEESDQFMFYLFSWRPHFNCMTSWVVVDGIYSTGKFSNHGTKGLGKQCKLWADSSWTWKGVSNEPADDAAQFINLNSYAHNLNNFGKNSSAWMWGWVWFSIIYLSLFIWLDLRLNTLSAMNQKWQNANFSHVKPVLGNNAQPVGF